MAYSVVQHPTPGTGSASPTTAVNWASGPTNGNLLLVALTYRGNATTTENTTQGWIKAATITNGTTCQTDLWYRIAGVGEGTAGPTFNIAAAVAYVIQQAEITGFTGTPTLDQTGTNGVGTGVSTQTATVGATITAASELVFGCCGDREGATTGITWSASTAGGGATLGADIDTTNPPKNGEGLRDTWATSGGSGTSPSITFNLSVATNTTLASCIATFKGVVAAAVPVTGKTSQKKVGRVAASTARRAASPATVGPTRASMKIPARAIWRGRPRAGIAPFVAAAVVVTVAPTTVAVRQKASFPRPRPSQAKVASAPPTITPTVAKTVQKGVIPRPLVRIRLANSPATVSPTQVKARQKPSILRPPPRVQLVLASAVAVLRNLSKPKPLPFRLRPQARITTAPTTIAPTLASARQKPTIKVPPPRVRLASSPPTVASTQATVKQKTTILRPKFQARVVPFPSLAIVQASGKLRPPSPRPRPQGRLATSPPVGLPTVAIAKQKAVGKVGRPQLRIAPAMAVLPPVVALAVRQKPTIGRPFGASRGQRIPAPIVPGAKPELLIDLGGNLYYDFVNGRIALKVA